MADAKTIGFNFVPAGNYYGNWERYFQEYNSQLAEFKGQVTDPEADDEPEEPESPVAILEAGHLIDPTTLPKSAKALVARLEAAGWTLRAQSSRTFQEGGVYGPNAQKAGEKKRDMDLTHYWVAGKLGASLFMAYWVTDQGRNLFKDCLTNDRIFRKVGDMNDWLLERSLDNDTGTEDRN